MTNTSTPHRPGGTRTGASVAARDDPLLENILADLHNLRARPPRAGRAAEREGPASFQYPYDRQLSIEDTRSPSPAPSFVSSKSGIDSLHGSIFDFQPCSIKVPCGGQRQPYDNWPDLRALGLEEPSPRGAPLSQPPNDVLPAPNPDFESPTRILRCEILECGFTADMGEGEALIRHYYDQHFQDLPPPRTCICTFCDDVTFQTSRDGDPHANFRKRMMHILEHFQARSEGHLVGKTRFDFWLINYLHENVKIDNDTYKKIRIEQERRCRQDPSIVSPCLGRTGGVIGKASPRKGRQDMVKMALRQGRDMRRQREHAGTVSVW